MNNSLTLIVRIKARKERAEEVKQSLLDILEPTRAEAGCESYKLYIDDKEPSVFIFVDPLSYTPQVPPRPQTAARV